jgi:hypothetical protein
LEGVVSEAAGVRRLTTLLALALLALSRGAGPASGELVPFTGELTIEIGRIATVALPGSGLATVNESGAGHPIAHVSIPEGAFATAVTIPLPNAFPLGTTFPLLQLRADLFNRSIALSGGGCTRDHEYVVCPGTGLHGFGGLRGRLFLDALFVGTHMTTSSTLTFPITLSIPPSFIGGGSMGTGTILGTGVQIWGAGWTTGTVSVQNPTPTIFTHVPSTFHVFPTLTFTGSQSVPADYGTTQTAMGSRMTNPGSDFRTDSITLVSPIMIVLSPPSVGVYVPSMARLEMHLLPEPGAVLLVGTGIAAFAVYARRLRKR